MIKILDENTCSNNNNSFLKKTSIHITTHYAGPLYVKNVYNPEDDMYKVWIVLYTCVSSRALLLDAVHSLSADSCIKSLRIFFSRRGTPSLIVSDNGTAFTSSETQRFTANLGVT